MLAFSPETTFHIRASLTIYFVRSLPGKKLHCLVLSGIITFQANSSERSFVIKNFFGWWGAVMRVEKKLERDKHFLERGFEECQDSTNILFQLFFSGNCISKQLVKYFLFTFTNVVRFGLMCYTQKSNSQPFAYFKDT